MHLSLESKPSFNSYLLHLGTVRDDAVVKKMAAMLKSGAAMLDQLCPNCKVPLFRLKTGEVVCASCGQRFVIVSSDEEELEVKGNLVMQELEKVAVEQLARLATAMRTAKEYEEVSEAVDVALGLLRVIEYTRRIRRGK